MQRSFFFEVVSVNISFQTANRPATGLSPGLRSGLRAGKPGFRGVQTQSKAGFRASFRAGLGWFYRGFKTTVIVPVGDPILNMFLNSPQRYRDALPGPPARRVQGPRPIVRHWHRGRGRGGAPTDCLEAATFDLFCYFSNSEHF